mmetsp:Transcript_27675/g.35609  ORF Transcript_27675/g.35609 Transcript_27675/m.35609 type:complete len:372 (-) Transcript_27675:262-1377(-)
MNTSPTTTTCPLAKETGTEIVSPTGSELTSTSLDVEQANDDASAAVDASPKAKTMKEVLMRYGYGRGLAVAVVIALAGKGIVARAHNDPPGTDDVMMNVDLGIADSDSSKQVALLDGDGDGKNVANYDFTKVDGGVSTVRTLEQGQNPTIIYDFTYVGNGACTDSNNNVHDYIYFTATANLDECKAQCGACPGQGQAAGRELRGLVYGNGICNCLLDDGDLFTESVCPGALSSGSNLSGTGAICNLTCLGTRECWKVVDSNLQCPTPAPTNEPTSSPSMSPTKSPSTAPTASPTAPPSIAPTESPTSAATNSKSAKVAKKVKSSEATEVNQLGAAANMQVQEMKSGGSSFSIISRPLVGVLALIVFSNLLP